MRVLLPLLAALSILMSVTVGGAAENVVIRVRVLDVQEKPVEGAEVFLYDTPVTRRPSLFISPRTDSAGRSELVVPQAKYWAVARVRQGEKFGPLGIGARHSGEPVELDPDDNQAGEKTFVVADIRELARQREVVRENSVRITGRIVTRAGSPAVKSYVFAEREGDRKEIPAYLSLWTGEDGNFVLVVPAGSTYRLGAAAVFPPPAGGERVTVVTEAGKSEMSADVPLAVAP